MSDSYGLARSRSNDPELQNSVIWETGYAVLSNVLSPAAAADFRDRIIGVYETQAERAALPLEQLNEAGLARSPWINDPAFFDVILSDKISAAIRSYLQQPYCLHLQNGIILSPTKVASSQRRWHRDIPHQRFLPSSPMSVSVLVALEDTDESNGSTQLIPCSHRIADVDADFLDTCEIVSPSLRAGDALIFDSFIVHRSGVNSSAKERCVLNHVFTTPILRPQVSVYRALLELGSDMTSLSESQAQVLGFPYESAQSVDELRHRVSLRQAARAT